MIFPPSILRVRRREPGRCNRNLWLPLILIWPVVVALWLVLLPGLTILALMLWKTGAGRAILLGPPKLFGLFCRLRGLSIDVESEDTFVRVYLI